ncbi:MAG: hypothetical protein ACXWDR_08045 [Actinomycetota bacterium]
MGPTVNGLAAVTTPRLQLWLFTAVVFLVTASLVGVAFEALVRRLRAARRDGYRERACADFADAVALWDFDGADEIAALVFAGSEGGGVRGSCHERRGRERVIEWDERTRFALPLEEVRRQFIEPAATGFWFPDMERVPRGGGIDLLLGPGEPIRVRLFEAWTPELDSCSFTGESSAFRVSGCLDLRTVIVSAREADDVATATEAWVHVEAPASEEARQALARARTIVREGLGRMAAELNPIGPR